MNYLRKFRLLLLGLVASFAAACTENDSIDNREIDYGYAQFKLYKEASYDDVSRAVVSQLDYLNRATKITVNMNYDGDAIIQTLNLSAADDSAAEFGLRSDKLKLLTGEYRVVSFTLYDVEDQPLYIAANSRTETLSVVTGGLSSYDLTVNVSPRGAVQFTLVKEGIEKTPYPETRVPSRDYTFDEITKADISVKNNNSGRTYTFTGLKMKFSTFFDPDNQADNTPGYTTSACKCDSLLYLPAGKYTVDSYRLYDSYNATLEGNNNPPLSEFVIEDNKTTQADVAVTLYTDAAYINDYRVLKAIWDALNGEEWYYAGENFPKGCNWDFNKDIDLWGDQPGVQLHSNGRVARLDLSDFGVRGDIPEELGQLSELVELYLGTHGDTNQLEYDPTTDFSQSVAQRSRNRMANHKAYLAAAHPAPQMSEPCARGLREHNIVVPETALYLKGMTENELIDPATGVQKHFRLHDLLSGKLCNGITSVPASIGNLKKLEYLYIANGEIASLPDEIGELESLTDLEIYNCPKLTEFPMGIARLPELVSINISNNKQWSAQQLHDGLDALAQGPSAEKIQILYCSDNNLEELPASFANMTKLGLLDFASNNISKLHALGKNVPLVQVYFDENQIEEFPVDDEGYFCQMEDMETFSAPWNKLTKFPNIFQTKLFTISSIDLSGNQISEFPSREEFKGIRVTTLTLSQNPITKFPAVLINNDKDSSVAYIVLRACSLEEFEKNAFVGKNSAALMSLDLSYNHLTKLPEDLRASNMPYLYGVDVSHNRFSKFPYEPFDAYTLTIFAVRAQRDENGRRCLTEWPTGVYQHSGLRALYVGSNDIRKVNDQISYLIYYLDISDNPNITFDASDICAYWRAGYYYLIYDKSQNITNCPEMLE